MPELDRRLTLALRDPIAPIAPPAGLEARVISTVLGAAEEPPAPVAPRGGRSWWPRAGFAFAGAAALAVAIGVAFMPRGGTDGTLELQTVLLADTSAEEASVEVRKTGIGRVIDLRSDSLPILPKGEYYELWFVGPGDAPGRPNRISAGTFHPDEDGRSHVVFAAAVDPALYPVLSVTAEPGDGDPAPSATEVLRSPRS